MSYDIFFAQNTFDAGVKFVVTESFFVRIIVIMSKNFIICSVPATLRSSELTPLRSTSKAILSLNTLLLRRLPPRLTMQDVAAG